MAKVKLTPELKQEVSKEKKAWREMIARAKRKQSLIEIKIIKR